MKIKTRRIIDEYLEKLNLRGTSYEVVGEFIEDIMKHENVNYNEIKNIGGGKMSQNLKIGDYVLKIGEGRRTEQIENHFRILQPIIRRQIPMQNEEKKLFIEVQNEVEADWYRKVEPSQIMEIMYQVYRDIRSAGMVWTDIRVTNIGRLKRDNITHYESRDNVIEPNQTSTGLSGEPSRILKAGEYVILDTDYIFDNDEINKTGINNMLLPIYYDNFEKRYQREKVNERDR